MGGQDGTRQQGRTAVGGQARAPRKSDEGRVGGALREAYRATVEEPVPDDLLDLLNKLS
ncbi:NepR family anti-sigma factor [Sphingomonas antarctica]|uniref:NepR family anti-sigma factor n=1 Tax=Sphingomonas antarctica TaxID=2040274 RepID=UPI0039EB7DC1